MKKRLIVAITGASGAAYGVRMAAVAEMGAIVFPPVPAFYTQPATIDDIVNHTAGRVLDLFDIAHAGLVKRWQGMKVSAAAADDTVVEENNLTTKE